jgi:Na+-translocating ferredoxin:NAD+ oxidoreductase RnfD subunit
MNMKLPSLHAYMIFSLVVLILFNLYHDIFTLRIIEAVLISLIAAILLDGLFIWKKEGKVRFPSSALISGLIIAALIEPELENRLVYFVPPVIAILSKHLIRVANRNVFNPAAIGLLATVIFSQAGITWWATTPIYLVVPLGLFIVYKMKGWLLVISFLLAAVPLYFIYGVVHHIDIVESIGLINLFFVLFMLTEHKSAPMANRIKVIYGGIIGILSFVYYQYVPQVDNSILALLTGNLSVPVMNKLYGMRSSQQPNKVT